MTTDDRLLVPCGDGPNHRRRARRRGVVPQLDRRQVRCGRPVRRMLAGARAPHRGPRLAVRVGCHTRRL